jgi:uncharacterized protein YdaU (DUF1376 family)
MYYYKFNIADWHLATSHLSLEEEAIYFRLINYYYDSEQAIPEETQSVIRRLRLGSYSETVGIILKEFFTLESDGWHHKRCDDEISQYHDKAEVNQINGKKGGRPKKTQTVSKDNPDITLTKNHKPLTKNHIKATGVPPEDVSNDIFQDYLKIRNAKKSPWTPTAQKLMRNEAQKAGISLQEAMEVCCARGWVGFKAEWHKKETNNAQQGDKSWMFSNEGIEAKARELGVSDYGVANHFQLKDKILQIMAKKALQ